MFSHYLLGVTTLLTLIVAIGAQNAYVLRQAILGKFVVPIVLFCIVSDILLVGLGVFGFGIIVESAPWLLEILRWGGGAFLLWYGFSAARRSLKPSALKVDASTQGPQTLQRALVLAAAMTYLNPHTYIDTVVLLGALANQQGDEGRWYYYAGCATGSVLWFIALGFGARFLRPVFANPKAWRVLDGLIALLMFFLAYKVMFGMH
ncbi:amino acid transporter [Rothia sp. ZJ932]|nr:amino acid transporter [Rothia sp. ZJ1223]QRZ62668.1 amino acid transporter [Rothia sp. ZJ932]